MLDDCFFAAKMLFLEKKDGYCYNHPDKKTGLERIRKDETWRKKKGSKRTFI